MIHYFRIDKQGFDELTPNETSILLSIMEEDKKKQNGESKSGAINIPANVSDENFF